ncbi:MAG TPA: hypothetical protein PLD49_04900 [Thermoclostridium caenicola]|uniref:Uncharacterized protein n=1 Tax=Thermoclostridium caenicola TaxID=659425 RepID=A0A1M6CK99_9FIRM|nr:hypothetical protein [Thermoclostridium caenicola]SHI61445.1 hypothetical protein SAMN05444373_100550 [Thermoclostridium caenicola]HOK42984.1 hypothetical protein [Thermoclostridium caenicola]HOL85099.1 hypothetical protein [Thermoclostridium caenicola]HPO77512.1 hypothetical protein [Thermoclostridium caenicola]HPU21779.1 hypothetical protein [Thermoclostridium caenicola]
MDEVRRSCKRPILIASGILGFLLIVFGVVLIGLGIVGFDFVIIGTIIAGVLLLLLLGVNPFLRDKRILCITLVLVALFLIIGGIIALPGIIGLTMIGLGVVAAILAVLCFNCF